MTWLILLIVLNLDGFERPSFRHGLPPADPRFVTPAGRTAELYREAAVDLPPDVADAARAVTLNGPMAEAEARELLGVLASVRVKLDRHAEAALRPAVDWGAVDAASDLLPGRLVPLHTAIAAEAVARAATGREDRALGRLLQLLLAAEHYRRSPGANGLVWGFLAEQAAFDAALAIDWQPNRLAMLRNVIAALPDPPPLASRLEVERRAFMARLRPLRDEHPPADIDATLAEMFGDFGIELIDDQRRQFRDVAFRRRSIDALDAAMRADVDAAAASSPSDPRDWAGVAERFKNLDWLGRFVTFYGDGNANIASVNRAVLVRRSVFLVAADARLGRDVAGRVDSVENRPITVVVDAGRRWAVAETRPDPRPGETGANAQAVRYPVDSP